MARPAVAPYAAPADRTPPATASPPDEHSGTARELTALMTDVRRVIVTGSSTWDDERLTAEALDEVRQEALRDGCDGVLVVHGDRPQGADRLAADWCAANGVPTEPHPAGREARDEGAGHVRDRHMVGAGADLCLVFVGPCTSGVCRRPKPHGSHDAAACANLAREAGIPVRRRIADEARPRE